MWTCFNPSHFEEPFFSTCADRKTSKKEFNRNAMWGSVTFGIPIIGEPKVFQWKMSTCLQHLTPSRKPSFVSCVCVHKLQKHNTKIAKTQNPKQVSLNPRHNYPKSLLQQTFCSTHEHEPTKEDGCLSVFKYMLLLALLVVVLSSCDTSEPSYTKQSFMNAKEHSNTETLFQRNAEAFS